LSVYYTEDRPFLIPEGQNLLNVIGEDVGLWLERKRAEEKLHASEGKYRTLVENLPQKIFLKDKDSVYVSCNENYARDLGITPEGRAGKTDYDFFPKELAEKYRADDKRIMESGNTEEIDELADDKLRQLISQMETLPSLPPLYHELVEELQSPGPSIRVVGQIVSRDMGMTAKVLQLAQSTLFGPRRHVSSPAQAVTLLGLDTVKTSSSQPKCSLNLTRLNWRVYRSTHSGTTV